MPHRTYLLTALDTYAATWASGQVSYQGFDSLEENQTLLRLRSFVQRRPDCLERTCLEGHITGSALVCNRAMDKVLLTLHAKLGKWLQLGGHVDGETLVEHAAYREAQEESGLQSLSWVPQPFETYRSALFPFDCDIHLIPARGSEPEHSHYDLRYLLLADDAEPLQITAESKALRWLSLTEARRLTQERSMLRQFDKLDEIRTKISVQ
jgi:8-oxo-dGTP pyrophosphatase MutT (NUDIX family)